MDNLPGEIWVNYIFNMLDITSVVNITHINTNFYDYYNNHNYIRNRRRCAQYGYSLDHLISTNDVGLIHFATTVLNL